MELPQLHTTMHDCSAWLGASSNTIDCTAHARPILHCQVKLGPGGPAHKMKAAIAAGTAKPLPAARLTLLRGQLAEEHIRALSRHSQVKYTLHDKQPPLCQHLYC
jgi:hypothetical protein